MSVWKLIFDVGRELRHEFFWDGTEECRQRMLKTVDMLWPGRHSRHVPLTSFDVKALNKHGYGRVLMDFEIMEKGAPNNFPKEVWGDLMVMGLHLPHSSNLSYQFQIPLGAIVQIIGKDVPEKAWRWNMSPAENYSGEYAHIDHNTPIPKSSTSSLSKSAARRQRDYNNKWDDEFC